MKLSNYAFEHIQNANNSSIRVEYLIQIILFDHIADY